MVVTMNTCTCSCHYIIIIASFLHDRVPERVRCSVRREMKSSRRVGQKSRYPPSDDFGVDCLPHRISAQLSRPTIEAARGTAALPLLGCHQIKQDLTGRFLSSSRNKPRRSNRGAQELGKQSHDIVIYYVGLMRIMTSLQQWMETGMRSVQEQRSTKLCYSPLFECS